MPRPVASVWMKSSRFSAGSANPVRALRFEGKQVALHRADAGGRDVAVRRGELRGVVTDILQHRAQVFEIEQQHPVFIGDTDMMFNTPACVSLSCSKRESNKRTHFGNRRAHGVAFLTEHIPETVTGQPPQACSRQF